MSAHTSRALVGEWGPAVARIDKAYGDCNLVCGCPPVVVFAWVI